MPSGELPGRQLWSRNGLSLFWALKMGARDFLEAA